MSSISSFQPDNSDDSDFSLEPNRGRQQRRSNSRFESYSLKFPVSQDHSPSQDHANYKTERGGGNEDEPSSQNRWEQRDALLADLNESSLAQYTTLFEQVESEILSAKFTETNETYTDAQNGSIAWTSTEKALLFKLLDRNGKNGIKQIAAILGSKSELEVLDYLKLLQRGLEGQHLLDRQLKTIVMGDIPAAMEVSKECCAELDKYARVLAMREDLDLELACRTTYDENAIIADAQARKLVAEEVNPPLRGRIDLAANLLHVPGWTQLSETFFMNFGGSRSEDCWSNVVQSRSESPALYGEALMDFYALTMSVTRRLIQSAIFFAMSRLNGLHAMGRERRRLIRKRDVRAALDVLNMKPDRAGFFVDVARRNRLVITDTVDGEEQVVSYDEAEEILQEDEDSSSDSDQDDIASGLEENDSETKSDAVNSEHAPLPSSPPTFPTATWDKIPLDLEEEHANLLDREMSRREEINLWCLLEEPVPSHLQHSLIPENETETDTLARRPPSERKSREDLVDWRDRVLYRSEWEEYGDGIQDLEDELAENRRKRRWDMYEEDLLEEESEEKTKRPRRIRNRRKRRPRVLYLSKSSRLMIHLTILETQRRKMKVQMK
ncbi:hypothetical protein N7520_007190 [Penicillium odoratum]|uniref:uncharacterized protein n=1 Tax=Penicillium odoratum TaxID=1167516 RepID=UPI0025475FA1|nr:uncharacterized protein N7520_007190 [Penicillium odoratum]KAJ5760034.1 hypothetical protein N7520_007190 [Penicillium odoratum]